MSTIRNVLGRVRRQWVLAHRSYGAAVRCLLLNVNSQKRHITRRCTRAGGDVDFEVNATRARRVNLVVLSDEVMPSSSTEARPMTDSEFDEWTRVRARGKGYFRRKYFFLNSIISGIAIAILAVIEYGRIAPDWIRLLLPDVLIPCFIGFPFLMTVVFAPILWQLCQFAG